MLELMPEHQYSLFPSFGDFYFDAKMPLTNPYTGENIHYGPRHLTREKARSFWTGLEAESSLGSPEIIHSNNFWCPIQLAESRLIYTFYDMGFAVDPSWTTEANRIGCFEGVFRSAAAADWIVAISEASKNHYLTTFPNFPEDRVTVIYPCSRFSDAQAKGQRPTALESVASRGFWLNVGTIEPRKNQHRLAESYARYLTLGGRPMPLVLAGGKGWLMDGFQEHLARLGISQQVIMTGYVSDEELVWLYRNCYANLYPSLFEGFGLPVLEGMQFGAPTITSRSTSIPEVSGDAAILLDPENVEDWAQNMLRLSNVRVERDALGQASVLRASKFKWAESGAALLQVYKDAIRIPKRKNLR